MANPVDAPSELDSLRSIALTLFPWLAFAGAHTYRVARVNTDGTVDLDPPVGAPALPPLPKQPQWVGAGTEAAPAVGSEVLVVYRDNDPRRPALVSFTPLRASIPAKVSIDSTGPIVVGASATTIEAGGTTPVALAPAVEGALLALTTFGSALLAVNATPPVTLANVIAAIAAIASAGGALTTNIDAITNIEAAKLKG